MKALTLHQPWASLIAAGVKTIETRSWSTKHRGPIAIHAGKRDGFMAGQYGRGMYGDADALWRLRDDLLAVPEGEDGFDVIGTAPLGVIVATTELVDCVRIIEDRGAHFTPFNGPTDPPVILVGRDRARHWVGRDSTDVSDQVPLGDFTDGRWAWLLDNVQACDPIPAKGRQGLWTWEPAA